MGPKEVRRGTLSLTCFVAWDQEPGDAIPAESLEPASNAHHARTDRTHARTKRQVIGRLMVVPTAAQSETSWVTKVRVLIDGERADSIGDEVDVSEPSSRRDFDDVAPFIVVESPRLGEEVAVPSP
jgi:hypothetical protein